MKKSISYLAVGIVGVLLLSSCGNKKTALEEASEYYQNEWEMDEDSANEMAELAMEIQNEEAAIEETAIEEEVDVPQQDEYINSCFFDAIDKGLAYYSKYGLSLDRSILYMSEEELVETIGTPKTKKGDTLTWTLGDVISEGRSEIPQLNIMTGQNFNGFYAYISSLTGEAGKEGTYLCEYEDYFESVGDSSWSFFDDFLWNEDGSITYEASQMTCYNDLVDKIGNSGIFVDCDGKKIRIEWFFPADGNVHIVEGGEAFNFTYTATEPATLYIDFNPRTGAFYHGAGDDYLDSAAWVGSVYSTPYDYYVEGKYE